MKNEEIVLASASPRRRELLALFELPYRCVSADLDEASCLVKHQRSMFSA